MPDDLVPPAPPGDVAALALAGLLAQPKTLPAQLFYDEAGCELFYRITALPEYYLTRTELALLPAVAEDVTARLPLGSVLVEYGGSDETKAGFLLDQRRAGSAVFAAYVPIDVAAPALAAMRTRLRQTRPGLAVHPVVGDFLRQPRLPAAVRDLPALGFFPGSTIGNLDPEQAAGFLAGVRASLGASGRLLIGFDLRKDPALLVPAYDDAAGVTAAFNRNLLVRLNREVGADFDPTRFRHRALWNAARGRIEMHLVSQGPQTVRLAGVSIQFADDETIHTENSYKYTQPGFTGLATAAGWTTERTWTDPARLFAVHLLAT
jgi:L-histidine Nalpha-methyltransferase